VPDGLTARDLVAAMKERGIVIAGGQDAYAERIIRIGHMGFVGEEDILATMGALEEVLEGLRVVA
jgi:aspartate aminotransferase-like enzyme